MDIQAITDNVESFDPEWSLVQGIKAGEHKAFEELVNRYQKMLRAYVFIHAKQLRDSDEDVLQDIFLEILNGAQRFNRQSSVKTWVYKVAKNTINNKKRKRWLWFLGSEEEEQQEIATDPRMEPHGIFQAGHDIAVVRECIDLLDANSREVLHFYEIAGLNYADIAGILNIKVGTVRSRLFNAREKLAQLLREKL